MFNAINQFNLNRVLIALFTFCFLKTKRYYIQYIFANLRIIELTTQKNTLDRVILSDLMYIVSSNMFNLYATNDTRHDVTTGLDAESL